MGDHRISVFASLLWDVKIATLHGISFTCWMFDEYNEKQKKKYFQLASVTFDYFKVSPLSLLRQIIEKRKPSASKRDLAVYQLLGMALFASSFLPCFAFV
jgi:hypothetical protein